MLSHRLASAAVGVPLLVLAIWLGSYWLLGLVATAVVLGTWEFRRLALLITTPPPLAFSLAIALGLALPSYWDGEYLPIALGAAVVASLGWQAVWGPQGSAIKSKFIGLAGPFAIGAPLSLAILLRDGTDGRDWMLAALLATFSVDTGAYAVGRLIGRRQLAPRISPGKTWEGAVGGLLGGVGAAFGLTLILSLPMALWKALPLGLLLAVAAMLGDLAESWFKRTAGAKESGGLIPGHGGILDRTDSIVFTLVVTYFWVTWAL